MRGMALDLAHLGQVVVGDQRLVGIQLGQGAVVLDRVGVDDLVPDPILSLLGRHGPDVLVHDHELGHGGHVEAGARLEQGAHDPRVGVGLDRVVGLHARQVLLEGGVVAPNLAMVHHEKRGSMLLGQLLEKLG